MLKSKLIVALAFLAVVICICFTFKMRSAWWCFIDIFCFFMATFTQLMALTLGAKIPAAGKKFTLIALCFAIAGVIALIVESVIWLSMS